MPRPLAAALLTTLLLSLPTAPRAADRDPPLRRQLAAHLFGEVVGEVRLTLRTSPSEWTLTYRSDLLVVRDRVRLKQRAFIESSFDPATGALLRSSSRRCTSLDDESAPPSCTPMRKLGPAEAAGAAPALAAELLLARRAKAAKGESCLQVIDEESAKAGKACATATRAEGSTELVGSRFGVAFSARIDPSGLPEYVEFPSQGARFEAAEGEIDVSAEDLFADPIPSEGDVAAGLRAGHLRLRVTASPDALATLKLAAGPAQRLAESVADSVVIELRRVELPKSAKKMLTQAALLVAKARGSHVDCQTATQWFLDRARERGWKAHRAIGFAWVDGRFAFHSWAVVETKEGPLPMDPLLAQVPADAGHVQLATEGESAGMTLVAFRRGLSLSVE